MLKEISIVLLCLAALIGFIFWAAEHDAKVTESRRQAAYPVWVKQTGNPKNLTYEEWRTLIVLEEQKSSSKDTTVVMPIYMGK